MSFDTFHTITSDWLWSSNKNDWCANESFSRLRSTGWTLMRLSEGSAGATCFPFRGAQGPPGLLLASLRVFFLWADRSEGATGWPVILAQRWRWLYSLALSLTDVSNLSQIVHNRALLMGRRIDNLATSFNTSESVAGGGVQLQFLLNTLSRIEAFIVLCFAFSREFL